MRGRRFGVWGGHAIAVALSLVVGLSAWAPPAAGAAMGILDPGLGRLVSPADYALVVGAKVRISVRLSGRARSFSVQLDGRNMTAHFRHVGRVRVAVVRRGLVGPGVHHVLLTIRGPGGLIDRQGSTIIFGRRSRGYVQLSLPARIGASPVRMRALTSSPARIVRLTLNGHPLDGQLRTYRRRSRGVTVSPTHGLRYGRNVLRVLAIRSDGSYGVATRTFFVPRTRPLAAAGFDRIVRARATIRLDGRRSLASRAGERLSYRWTIVRSPPGSRARLRGADAARPSFLADRRGRYVVRLTVTERDPEGRLVRGSDDVAFYAQSSIPPLGIPVETFYRVPGSGQFGVWLGQTGDALCTQGVAGGELCPNTGGQQSIEMVVLDRSTLAVQQVESFSTQSASSLSSLQSTLQGLGESVPDNELPPLVILSAPPAPRSAYFLPSNLVPNFTQAVEQIGGPAQFTYVDQDFFNGDRTGAVSFLGSPGWAPGQAYQNVGMFDRSRHGSLRTKGSLVGYLNLAGSGNSTTTNTPSFNFTFPDSAPYDTSVLNSGGIGNVMRIGGRSYVGGSMSSGEAGFQVVVVRADTLRPVTGYSPPPGQQCVSNCTFIVNGNSSTAQDGVEMEDMATFVSEFNYADDILVFIQSFGDPKPTAVQWGALANSVATVGGTPDIVMRMDGTFNYALAGGYGVIGGAQETASKLATVRNGQLATAETGLPDRLTGILVRGNRARFYPAFGVQYASEGPSLGSTIDFNFKLLPITYQKPTPWPTGSAGTQPQALAYITSQLLGCTAGSPGCTSIRDYFPQVLGTGNGWSNLRIALTGLCYPWATGCKSPKPSENPTFSSSDYEAVQKDLENEFQWVEGVQAALGPPGGNTLGAVQVVFANDAPLVDLGALGSAVRSSVGNPSAGSVEGTVLNVLASVVSIGAAAVPVLGEASSGATALASTLGMLSGGGYAAGAIAPALDGSPALGTLETSAANLQADVANDYAATSAQMTQIGEILVSDYGKLKAAGLPLYNAALPQYHRWQFDAEAAEPDITLGTEQWFMGRYMPLVYTAEQFPPSYSFGDASRCKILSGDDVTYPFAGAPNSAQWYMGQGLSSSLQLQGRLWGWYKAPSSNLTDAIFAPTTQTNPSWVTPGHAGLGLYPSWFWWRNFPLTNGTASECAAP